MYRLSKTVLGFVIMVAFSILISIAGANYSQGEGNNGQDSHDQDGDRQTMHMEFTLQREAIKNRWKGAIADRKEQMATIHANIEAFHDEYGYISVFLKGDLSIAEKDAIEKIIDDFHTDREALFDTLIESKKDGDNIDKEVFMEEFLDLRAEYYAALRAYVDPAKYADYDAFVVARTEVIRQNMAIREERWAGNRAWIHARYKDLDYDKNKDRIDHAVDSIKGKIQLLTPAALQFLLGKVNAALVISANNEVLTNLLGEIKVYIELLLAL